MFCTVLFCSAVWCSAADTHLKELDHVVSGASFLTEGVFKCDLARRRSVAVLCMLNKIRCSPMHPLYGAQPVQYLPVRVTRCDVISHRYPNAPPRCRTSLYRRTFIRLSVSLCNDLGDPYSIVWDWQVSRAGLMPFYGSSCSVHFLSLTVFPFSSFILWVGIVELGSSD